MPGLFWAEGATWDHARSHPPARELAPQQRPDCLPGVSGPRSHEQGPPDMVSPVSLDFPAGQAGLPLLSSSSPHHPNSPAPVPTSLENLSPELSHPLLCFHMSPVQKALPSMFSPVSSLTTSFVLSPPHINSCELPERWDLVPSTCYPTEFIARPLHNTYRPGLPGWRLFQSSSVSLSPGRLALSRILPIFICCVSRTRLLSHTACGSALRSSLLTFPFLCKKPLWEGVAGCEFSGRAEAELSRRPS